MQIFTLEHLIKIERVTSRAVNALRGFAEGEDRQMLEDLTTLVSEIRHAASCTQEGEISIADLWQAAEARKRDHEASIMRGVQAGQDRMIQEAAAAAFESWGRGGCESTAAAKRWAEHYQVDRWAVQDLLSDLIQAEFKRKGL